ncbi:MAG: ribonuclease III [Halanaerobiales bacterium]|nr:ribonuclease III [Halanaerobiales bacterium]
MAVLVNKGLLAGLQRKLKISLKDQTLLQRALIHKSFRYENIGLNLKDNERLEFLGDSVLSIIISTYIFHNFPDYPEGELAKMRSVIVSEPILALKARSLGLGEFLFLGKGEEITGGRKRDSLLADTMEAIFGCVYLDQGFKYTKDFIINLFADIIGEVEKGNYILDYKTQLQEMLQRNSDQRPEYSVIKETGPDHNKLFTIEAKYNQESLGRGEGSSKKEAEQKAARAALKKLGEL